MADEKIQELAELLDPDDDDELAIDDVSAPRETKRIKVQNLIGALEYGEMHAQNGVASQTLSSGSYTKVTQFLSNGLASDDVTPDHVNDKLTINRTGIYMVGLHVSFGGSGSVSWDVAVFQAGLETHIEFERKLGATGDIGAGAAFGFLDITSAPTDLDIRAQPDGANKTFQVKHAQFLVLRLANT